MRGLRDITVGLKRLFERVQPGRVGKIFGRKTELYRAVRVEDLPESPKPLRLYIAGEPKQEWGAAMLCPCGCGDTIQLNLLREVRPRWRFTENNVGPSLEPSVWRKQGCRSHFFLRSGEIQWCDLPVNPPRKPKKRWF
jgi:hypothetical protein